MMMGGFEFGLLEFFVGGCFENDLNSWYLDSTNRINFVFRHEGETPF